MSAIPRPLRLEVPGGVYHLIARGNEQKAIFRDDWDRAIYLDRLADCRRRFGFFLYAYCLMDNHLHLAIERGSTPVSRIMHNLQSFYGQRFNRRHDRVGHLFQGRYKAFLVEKERYLLALLRYIHDNPVKAGLVAQAADYRWSSGRCFEKGSGPEWLDVDRAMEMLTPGSSAEVSQHHRMTRASPFSYDEAKPVANVIKGGEQFAEQILALSGRSSGENTVRVSQQAAERIARAVGAAFGLSVEEMMRRGQAVRPSKARVIAAYLGRREAGVTVARIARYFGRDSSTLTRGVCRLEAAMARDDQLRSRIDGIAARLDPQSA